MTTLKLGKTNRVVPITRREPVTVIRLNNSAGEINRVELSDRDATCEAIAQAVIDMVATCMNLQEGDSITITSE
jgi:hypothetical protein